MLIIIFFFYYQYFFLNKEKVDLVNQNQNSEIIASDNNLIKDLEYLSTDKNGNTYLITSEYGEISSTDSTIILMTNVIAEIDLFEKETIYLTSNFAKYNNFSYDTKFNGNVILNYIGHEITSENIDLSINESFVEVYNNVIYKSSINEIFADKLEIDLLTKDSKIFMFDNTKIKIIGK